MSGTVAAISSGLTMEAISGTASRWAITAVVLPMTIAGGYWGISSIVQAGRDIGALHTTVATISREMDRLDRASRVADDELHKQLESAIQRGEARRREQEQDYRDRAAANSSRINQLEAQLNSLAGGVIELRTEQRGISAAIGRIEGAVNGIAARPPASQTLVAPIAPQPQGRATSVPGWNGR